MTDGAAVAASIERFSPDVVVHCAIMNDHELMREDSDAAWDSYVNATRATAAAAHGVGASFVLVSTDWVFDGTQGGADEDTPANPINQYGVLKMASEIVAIERGGAVARVSGVNGVHRARPRAPRSQDAGFGYFVASLVDTARDGTEFAVWESDDINMIATPSLASESATMIIDIGRQGLTGVFHCCGADAVGRMELANLACEVFELDRSLIRSENPPLAMYSGTRIPYDTSITAPRTSAFLGREPTPVRALLERFRLEYESSAA
jgi:dTDP-4-dehydrorhamnose reductase